VPELFILTAFSNSFFQLYISYLKLLRHNERSYGCLYKLFAKF